MAEKELPDEGPSLEMPSLSSLFKRGRKKSAAQGSDPAAGRGEAAGDAVDGSRRSEQTGGDADRGGDAPSAADFERLVRGDGPESGSDDAAAVREVVTSTESAVEETAVRGRTPATDESADAAASPDTPAPDTSTPDPAEGSGSPADAGAATGQGAGQHATAALPELPEHDLIAAEEEPSLGDLDEDDPAPATEQTAVAPSVSDSSTGAARQTGQPAQTGPSAQTGPTDAPKETADGRSAAAPAPAATAGPAATPSPAATATPAATLASAAKPSPATVATETTTGSSAEDDDLASEFDDGDGEAASRDALGGFGWPALPAAAAAAITGAIVGLLAVGLTYFGLQGCEAVKGTSACGGPGIPILVVIMVLLVVVGGALLTAWKVTDPTSTSFLAVGLLAVIALLFLIEVIFSPAMIVVIPLVSVGTYCLSQWVTARFIEED